MVSSGEVDEGDQTGKRSVRRAAVRIGDGDCVFLRLACRSDWTDRGDDRAIVVAASKDRNQACCESGCGKSTAKELTGRAAERIPRPRLRLLICC